MLVMNLVVIYYMYANTLHSRCFPQIQKFALRIFHPEPCSTGPPDGVQTLRPSASASPFSHYDLQTTEDTVSLLFTMETSSIDGEKIKSLLFLWL